MANEPVAFVVQGEERHMIGTPTQRENRRSRRFAANCWPDLAGPPILSSAGRDFAAVSFFEGKTDGFETD
jgi:hypothetical protein